jgi:ABC-2 type transport system permease protein
VEGPPLSLALLHARMLTLELVRYPAFLVPTLLFPSLFFLFFASYGPPRDADVKMATFAGFAAIGVAFFQFGVGIAVERASPWESYMRTLPVGAVVRLGARVISAAVFASAATAILIAVALATTGASLPPPRWVGLALALLVGSIPFALFGIALGYWAPARGALPIANLLYLGLAYAGALWMRPDNLPPAVRGVSPYLPTRALSDTLAGAVSGTTELAAWLVLGGYGVAFALLAAWGYRRDEGRRFR